MGAMIDDAVNLKGDYYTMAKNHASNDDMMMSGRRNRKLVKGYTRLMHMMNLTARASNSAAFLITEFMSIIILVPIGLLLVMHFQGITPENFSRLGIFPAIIEIMLLCVALMDTVFYYSEDAVRLLTVITSAPEIRRIWKANSNLIEDETGRLPFATNPKTVPVYRWNHQFDYMDLYLLIQMLRKVMNHDNNADNALSISIDNLNETVIELELVKLDADRCMQSGGLLISALGLIYDRKNAGNAGIRPEQLIDKAAEIIADGCK